jgi:hypothetical protein
MPFSHQSAHAVVEREIGNSSSAQAVMPNYLSMTTPVTTALYRSLLQPQQVQLADDAPARDRYFIGLLPHFDMKPR